MNTLPIAQKIQAKYLRAVNNEMIGNYQHSIVVHIMRRIVKLIFETPDFAIDLPIEPRWRDYYTTALQISAYLSYVQYEIIADNTIAHISLTDRYRAQILAAATPPPTDTAPAPAPTPAECSESPAAPAVTTLAPSASAPASTPAECSECSESATDVADAAAPTAAAATPAECSEPPSTPTAASATPAAPSGRGLPRVAANFRLKAVTTASLEGSLCISRGQGRPGRPQPSDSLDSSIKSAKTQPCPHKPRPSHLSPTAPTATPMAMPQPHPPRPPTTRLSAALIQSIACRYVLNLLLTL